jgi:hypothetical protein
MNEPNTTWDPEQASAESEQLSFMGELWQFVWENKLWWMTPTILILGALVTLICMTTDSAIAPFFYALF